MLPSLLRQSKRRCQQQCGALADMCPPLNPTLKLVGFVKAILLNVTFSRERVRPEASLKLVPVPTSSTQLRSLLPSSQIAPAWAGGSSAQWQLAMLERCPSSSRTSVWGASASTLQSTSGLGEAATCTARLECWTSQPSCVEQLPAWHFDDDTQADGCRRVNLRPCRVFPDPFSRWRQRPGAL